MVQHKHEGGREEKKGRGEKKDEKKSGRKGALEEGTERQTGVGGKEGGKGEEYSFALRPPFLLAT